MVKRFLSYITEKSEVAEEDLCRIEAVCHVRKFRKGQYLMHEGQIWRDVAFVSKGCLRTFSIDNSGKEHTVYFAVENWWTGDRQSFLTGEPTRFNIDALENSEVVVIERKNFDNLCKELPAFCNMINAILQRSFVVHQSRIHAYVSMSAKDNYLRFVEKYPNMSSRIPQNMIASFLGIAPETLSRIRRHLKTGSSLPGN